MRSVPGALRRAITDCPVGAEQLPNKFVAVRRADHRRRITIHELEGPEYSARRGRGNENWVNLSAFHRGFAAFRHKNQPLVKNPERRR